MPSSRAKQIYQAIKNLNDVEEPFHQLISRQAAMMGQAKKALVDAGIDPRAADQILIMRGLNISGLSAEMIFDDSDEDEDGDDQPEIAD